MRRSDRLNRWSTQSDDTDDKLDWTLRHDLSLKEVLCCHKCVTLLVLSRCGGVSVMVLV